MRSIQKYDNAMKSKPAWVMLQPVTRINKSGYVYMSKNFLRNLNVSPFRLVLPHHACPEWLTANAMPVLKNRILRVAIALLYKNKK